MLVIDHADLAAGPRLRMDLVEVVDFAAAGAAVSRPAAPMVQAGNPLSFMVFSLDAAR